MTSPKPKNVAASVHQRLRNHARLTGDDPQYVLMRYGLERLMYRLSQSRHAHLFTVKGALMFLVWTGEQYRPTKDLDLMTARRRSATQLATVFREVCGKAVEDDGLIMVADSVKANEIREDNEYGGVRVALTAMLGTARIPLQIDIGFGDAVTPKARMHEFPALLGQAGPRLSMYPRETAIAEKYETMVRRGLVNSRLKDYYDLWVLMADFEFDGDLLKTALQATFSRRKTLLPADVPAGLSDEFAEDRLKQSQWTAFIQRTRFRKQVVADLKTVVDGIRAFLMPPSLAAQESKVFSQKWPKSGPWQAGT